MSTPQSRQDVSGIDYHLGDDVLWVRDGYIWTGRIEATPSAHEENLYTIMFAGTDTVEVGDDDILGCAAGFWCQLCGGKMSQNSSSGHDVGVVQNFTCTECGAGGKRYFEARTNIDNRVGALQASNAVLEGKPVDEIPERSQPGDIQ